MRRTGAISRTHNFLLPPSTALQQPMSISNTTTPTSSRSGRMSAEPSSSRYADYRLSTALNALDLDNLDLRNIDPLLASKLLEEIKSGADVRPLLEKLKRGEKVQGSMQSTNKAEKMVTFEDDLKTNTGNKLLNPGDVFM